MNARWLERFLWWVQQEQNLPAAIQAFCAVVTCVLTAGLVWVTRRYVLLTQAMSETSQRHLAASLQKWFCTRCGWIGRKRSSANFRASSVSPANWPLLEEYAK